MLALGLLLSAESYSTEVYKKLACKIISPEALREEFWCRTSSNTCMCT
jgi:hypothetical protein